MKILIAVLLIFGFLQITNAQDYKPLSGRLVYEIAPIDTAMLKLMPKSIMVIFTNDTLMRVENETAQLGQQALIKHFEFNKSYLLLSIKEKNYAIQTDYSKEDTKVSKYTYKKKWGKRKVCGKKAKRLMVSHPDFKEPMEFLYFKQYSPKYIDAFKDFPGMVVQYYLPTADGILSYRLSYFEEIEIDKIFFGVPSDYEKITFDEFLELYLEAKGGGGQ